MTEPPASAAGCLAGRRSPLAAAARRVTSLLVLATLGPWGCQQPADAPRAAAPGTPIVLVSIDTLRADRLPAYGYDAVDTPALDRLRGDAILFRHAWAPTPLTFPSHTSMLTGLLPTEHGVRDNMGYRLASDRLPYLPRILKELGYATGAAVSSFVLRGNSGLAEGFDFYDDRIEVEGAAADLGTVQRDGAATLESARRWLRANAAGPFFLFFHIYEPHAPYDPPEPYASRYRSGYDGEIARADAIVGSLIEELESLGRYDSALVIVTSDHGEHLGDHGYHEHGPFLYREALAVPLLVKLPGSERGGDTVEAPAQLADIVPTVIELLGEPLPEGLAGRSLLRLEEEDATGRRLYAETYYPRLHFGWSELTSILDYPLHYIHGPDPELYDLEADPKELDNVIERERRAYRELREELRRYEHAPEAPEEVDPDTRRRLAALGYVGTVAGEREGPLPDPKARAHTLEGMRQAFLAARDGRDEEAIGLFRQVLAEEPGMIDGWESLGHALMRRGRVEEAWEAYRRAVELSGGAAHVALPAANALLALGRLDEAREHAELAAPVMDAAHDVLARIAIRQGRLDDAERHLERALATRAARVGPLVTRARLHLAREQFAEALAACDEAEAELGDASGESLGLDFLRGRAYVGLGEAEPAERAFQREIERSPDALDAYTHLAYLYALLGDGPRAGATLRRMVESNPSPAAHAAAVRTLRQMGDPGSAERLLRRALERWPRDEELKSL